MGSRRGFCWSQELLTEALGELSDLPAVPWESAADPSTARRKRDMIGKNLHSWKS